MITSRFIMGGCLAALLTLHGSLAWGQPMDSGFNYQGRLLLDGVPANGNYSFEFKLFSNPTNGFPLSTSLVTNMLVSDGLFSSIVPQSGLDVFNGDPRWLEIAVRPAGGNEFKTLSPRQQIMANPYAVHATQAESLAISGFGWTPSPELATNGPNIAYVNNNQTWSGSQSFSASVLFATPAANSLAPFAVLSSNKVDNLNANYLEGRNADGFWKVGGNTSSGIPGGGCIALGSLDDAPVEFLVNGLRALRLEATGNNPPSGTPNLIAGSPSNSVSPGVQGAAILGGGDPTSSIVPQEALNTVTGDFGTVAGGADNTAGAYSFAAGRGAQALHPGCFVWADNPASIIIPSNWSRTTGPNQFLIRATGGVRVLTDGAGMTLDSQPVLTGPVGPDQLADSAVTTVKLADGGVNTAKLAPGAITLSKMNTAGAAAGQAMLYNGSGVVWSNIPWSALSGIPAGFADGVDNNTTYTAGAGIDGVIIMGGIIAVAPSGINSSMLASNAVTSDKIVNGGNLAYVNQAQTWSGSQSFSAPMGIATVNPGPPTMALDVRDGSGPNAQGGNIHVGTTAAGGDPKLIHFGDLQGNGLGYVYLGENGADDTMELRAARFFFNTGDVGLGTDSPSYKLHVLGSVAGSGPYIDASDARYKTNVASLSRALESILRLRGVGYDWRQAEHPDKNFADGRQIGFIAQEVKEVLPEVVSQDREGFYSVAYSHIVPVLVEAIKEQQKQIQAQQTLIDELRSEQKRLSVQIALDHDKDTAALSQRLAALEKVIGARADTQSRLCPR